MLVEKRFVIARMLWVGVVGLAVLLFVIAIPDLFKQLYAASPEFITGLDNPDLILHIRAVYILVLQVFITAVFLATAIVIFWRKSTDWMGLFVSLTLATLGVAFSQTMYVFIFADSIWRLPALFIIALNWACNIIFFYVFPDGQFVPRWTRLLAIIWTGWALTWVIFSNTYMNPSLWPPSVVNFVFLGCYGTGIVSQVYRYLRVSGPVQRQQTKWVIYGLTTSILTYTAIVSIPLVVPVILQVGMYRLTYEFVAAPLAVLSLFLGPLSITFSIIRYRLWDIDRLINRTLVYGLLTAGVVGLYFALVAGLGALFQVSNNVTISVLATATVAVLFQPIRNWLQHGVNRLVYGESDDPYAVLSRLGQRLETTIAPESALPTVVETVAKALKLSYVAIALREGGVEDFKIAAEYKGKTALSRKDTENFEASSLHRFPLIYQSETLGYLLLAPHAIGESFTANEQRLLEDIARQAGIIAHTVRLTADLQRSRERLVAAREEERKRLRRDLHDGLGSQLASLTLTLAAAQQKLRTDPDAADKLFTKVTEHAQTAITDVRQLVYDLRPRALDDLGLVAALRDQVGRLGQSNLKITVRAPDTLPSLPAAVEVACYRIVQEAVTNVVKHAGAQNCLVTLSLDGALCVEIADDGCGLPANRQAGIGLTSMRERAEELGGQCVIETIAPRGTRIIARLPL